jgi:hypothetical protein
MCGSECGLGSEVSWVCRENRVEEFCYLHILPWKLEHQDCSKISFQLPDYKALQPRRLSSLRMAGNREEIRDWCLRITYAELLLIALTLISQTSLSRLPIGPDGAQAPTRNITQKLDLHSLTLKKGATCTSECPAVLPAYEWLNWGRTWNSCVLIFS